MTLFEQHMKGICPTNCGYCWAEENPRNLSSCPGCDQPTVYDPVAIGHYCHSCVFTADETAINHA